MKFVTRSVFICACLVLLASCQPGAAPNGTTGTASQNLRLAFGGGGPLHVAGYTEGVGYRDVLIPAWAAGFSAYGCACADFEYRYDQTIDMPIGVAYLQAFSTRLVRTCSILSGSA